MDCRLGSIVVPAATLTTFDTVSVVLLIPLFDRVVYPAFDRRGRRLSSLRKSGTGLLVAVASMLAAAALEHWRLRLVEQGDLLPSRNGAPPAVNLSVFWQAPQYLLVGASEVLTSVSQLARRAQLLLESVSLFPSLTRYEPPSRTPPIRHLLHHL